MAGTDTELWPSIPIADWQDTPHTLHLYTQVAGKVRLANEPLNNHWWNSTLYVRALLDELDVGTAIWPMPVEPVGARWDDDPSEFVLAYELVRTAPDPDAVLLDFLESTREAAATAAGWDRTALDRPNGANRHEPR